MNAANASLLADKHAQLQAERELDRKFPSTSLLTKDSNEARRRAFLSEFDNY